jgi:hypothetical protein
MHLLDICSGCHCYLKRQQPCCPFCGDVAPRRVAARFASRMSRTRWAAVGSALTLMSCNDAGPTSSPSDARVDRAVVDAGDGATTDAAGEPAADGSVIADVDDGKVGETILTSRSTVGWT